MLARLLQCLPLFSKLFLCTCLAYCFSIPVGHMQMQLVCRLAVTSRCAGHSVWSFCRLKRSTTPLPATYFGSLQLFFSQTECFSQTFQAFFCTMSGLLCLSTAKEGGLTSWSSSGAIYNRMLESHPEFVKVCTTSVSPCLFFCMTLTCHPKCCHCWLVSPLNSMLEQPTRVCGFTFKVSKPFVTCRLSSVWHPSRA